MAQRPLYVVARIDAAITRLRRAKELATGTDDLELQDMLLATTP